MSRAATRSVLPVLALLALGALAPWRVAHATEAGDGVPAPPAARESGAGATGERGTTGAVGQDVPAAGGGASGPAQGGPEVLNFRAFCDAWMQKLRERESYNTQHIAWEEHGGLVVGEHVSYGTDCGCVAREDPGKDPIGKITYREIRYRRRGATPAEALAAPGTIVEQSDVTEIFRYAKGRWQY